MTERLFDLLPAVYRVRDQAQGSPLRALLSVLDEEVRAVEDDIAGLYDNWFIETCDEWVVPYIGDLLGVTALAPVRDGVFSQRRFVANTLAYRRRKGTAGVLEALARDLTGWPARAVEYFERLATTQHVNHPRLRAAATTDVRDVRRPRDAGGAFDATTRTADVRHVDNGRGRHNIPHVALFLFRVQAQRLTDTVPRQVDARRFVIDPLGLDVPLVGVPAALPDGADVAPHHVPLSLSRRALQRDLRRWYGSTDDVGSVRVQVGGVPVPVEAIDVCDLSDTSGGSWAHAAAPGRVSLDPVLGRVAFGDAPASHVTTSHAYGRAGDLGGGPYDRRQSLAPWLADGIDWQMGVTQHPPLGDARVTASLADAVAAWNAQPPGTRGVITLMDSGTYAADLDTAATRIAVPAGSLLVLTSAQWPEEETGDALSPLARVTGRVVATGVRAHLRGAIGVIGTAPASSTNPGQFVLDGVLLEGALHLAAGNLGACGVQHATLAPGACAFVCDPNPRLRVVVSRSIVPALAMSPRAESLRVIDSIVDGAITGGSVSIERSTIVGATQCEQVEASEAIFVAPLTARRQQVGCVRFCALPFASVTPRRYRCHPARAEDAGRAPVFCSLRFGDPAYGLLAPACPTAIAEGAEDEGEMGVWHFLQAPMRLRNLRMALDEYLPFGLEAGVVVVSPARGDA